MKVRVLLVLDRLKCTWRHWMGGVNEDDTLKMAGARIVTE